MCKILVPCPTVYLLLSPSDLWKLCVAAPGRRMSPLAVSWPELTHPTEGFVPRAVLGRSSRGAQTLLAAAGEAGEQPPYPGGGWWGHQRCRSGPEISHPGL